MPRVGAVEGRGVAAPNKFVSEPFTVRFFVTGSAVGRQTLLSLVLCWLCGDSRSRLFFTQGSKFMFNLCRKGEENNIPFLFLFRKISKTTIAIVDSFSLGKIKIEAKRKLRSKSRNTRRLSIERRTIALPARKSFDQKAFSLDQNTVFIFFFSLHFARRSP